MKSITRVIIGLLIVVVGLSFLLTNLNVLPFSVAIQDWWPMFIVAAGAVMLLSDIRNYLWALLVMTLGVVLQLKGLDVIEANPWQLFWPAVIIVVGLSVMTSRGAAKQRIAASDREDVTAILSGNELRVQSDDYKSSRVVAVCGGVVLDLRDAVIKKEATVDLFTFWGGIEIHVPKGVVVKNETSAILGGVEDKSSSGSKKDAPVLHIIGDVVMGGVEIK